MNTRTLTRLAAALVSAAAVVVPASAASAATPVENCLTARPGAVTVAGIDAGDNLVCVGTGDVVTPSAGDDTYLWVPTDEATDSLNDRDHVFLNSQDAGLDTISLDLWGAAWTDSRMFASRVFFEADKVVLTPADDHIGDGGNASGCNPTAKAPIEFRTGAGDDTVNCLTGEVYTGTGADVVRGVTAFTTVYTGSGDDLAVGDANGDVIALGGGQDIAKVEAGGADTVSGGAGTDTVFASGNDTVTSAQVQ